jgi:hypothetical protein
MARIISNGNSSNGNGNGATVTRVEPYFKRLEPVAAEFESADGVKRASVRVFDDRTDIGQRNPGIIVQVFPFYVDKDGSTKVGKGGVVTVDTPAEVAEIADFLTEVADNL